MLKQIYLLIYNFLASQIFLIPVISILDDYMNKVLPRRIIRTCGYLEADSNVTTRIDSLG